MSIGDVLVNLDALAGGPGNGECGHEATSPADLPPTACGLQPVRKKRGRPFGKIPRKQTADGIPALLRREAGQYRVRLSMLPRAVAKVRQHTNGLRDGIETACVARHGGVSLSQALVIQSVCRTEENIRVLERLLKDGWDDLSLKDRADLLDRISRLSEKRDNHLAKLNLDNDHTAKADPFAVLDVTTTPVEGMPNE